MPGAKKEQVVHEVLENGFRKTGQKFMYNEVIILVGEAKKWANDFVAKMKGLKVGGGLEDGVDIGPLINRLVKCLWGV